MPYNQLDELPKNVKNVLPKHAQEIYQAAYNSAWDEYKNAEDRKDNSSREETAHNVAWSAVKQTYKKDKDDNWVKK